MKTLISSFTAVLFLVSFNGCAGNSLGSSPNNDKAQPASTQFLSNIDQEASLTTGDQLAAERFYVLMARLSVFALVCDSKNERKDSTKVSRLWNASTEMQKNAETVFGGNVPAYNRFEKQRNIESLRISKSDPTTCRNSQSAFETLVGLSASDLAQLIRSTPYGSL